MKKSHKATRLLLIEDDICLCQILRSTLTGRGFQVETAYDAISGLQKAYSHSPDLILLDIMLPDMDGWQACSRFREMTDLPIIMLTALGSVEDVVRGLDLGADDYITKPVTSDVLAARIRAVLRRASDLKFERRKAPIFKYDTLVIDFDKREVTVGSERVTLSPLEFRLLSMLARHEGRVLPHEYLLREVWGPEYMSAIDHLHLYVNYLRRKIERDPSQPTLICSEWGVGYRLGYPETP